MVLPPELFLSNVKSIIQSLHLKHSLFFLFVFYFYHFRIKFTCFLGVIRICQIWACQLGWLSLTGSFCTTASCLPFSAHTSLWCYTPSIQLSAPHYLTFISEALLALILPVPVSVDLCPSSGLQKICVTFSICIYSPLSHNYFMSRGSLISLWAI